MADLLRIQMNDVRAAIDSEGFDYCFTSYSNFDKVKDEKFHELRKQYKAAQKALEAYVKANSDSDDED